MGPAVHRGRDRRRGPRHRPLRSAAVRQRGGRHRWLPGPGAGRARAGPALRDRDQDARGNRGRGGGRPRVPGPPGALRPPPARRDQRQGGHQPAPVSLASRAAAGEARHGRAAGPGREPGRAAEGHAHRAGQGKPAGRDPRHRPRGGARAGRPAGRAGGAAVTVLCLTELEPDGGTVTDASLRALAFSRSLAELASTGPAREDVAAAVLDAPGPARAGGARAALAAAGVRTAHVADLGEAAGYAPLAWARALAELASTGLASTGPASAVVAAGTDHGQEVLAHLGTI